MGKFDPRLYEVLGRLNHDASPKEIKTAYRTFAKLYHPDKNKENPEYAKEMMVKLNAAYEILSNPEKREEYNKQLLDHLALEERRKLKEKLAAQERERKARYSQSSQSRTSTNSGVGALVGVGLALLVIGLVVDALSGNKK